MAIHRQIYIPPEGPPPPDPRLSEIYDKMGEDNIFKMLEDFYLALGKSEIREMFPKDLKNASQKSGEFFVFLLGGPPLYQQRHGSPRMRQRHFSFRIDEHARQVWMACFRETLINADAKYNFPLEYKEAFELFLERFSSWMVNTASD